jgi:hypothetical protein
MERDEQKKKQIKSRQIAVSIDGVHTDVVLSEFVNAIHVLVTQRGKVGHVFECSSDGGVPGEEGSETFTVDCLLGRREAVEEVFARQMVQALSATTEKKLLISLGLKEKEPPISTLQGLLAVLLANAFWKK